MRQPNDRGGLRVIAVMLWGLFIVLALNPPALQGYMGQATVWHLVIVGVIAFLVTSLAWATSHRDV